MSSGDGEGNKQREHLRNRQPGSDRTGHGARFHPWSAPSQKAQAALAPFAAAAEDACAARAGADDEQEQACLVAGSVHGSRASRAAALRLAGPPSGVLSNCLENLSVRTELGRAYRRRRRHALARRGTR